MNILGLPGGTLSLRKVLMISGIIIAVSILALGFGIRWFSGDLNAEARAVSALRERRQILLKGSELFAVLKDSESKADTYQQKLDSLLPPKVGVFALPELIEGLARVHRVNQTFTFTGDETVTQVELPGFVPFKVTAEGSYENLLAFFKGVEINQTQLLIVIDDFEFSRVDPQTSRLVFTARIFFRQ